MFPYFPNKTRSWLTTLVTVEESFWGKTLPRTKYEDTISGKEHLNLMGLKIFRSEKRHYLVFVGGGTITGHRATVEGYESAHSPGESLPMSPLIYNGGAKQTLTVQITSHATLIDTARGEGGGTRRSSSAGATRACYLFSARRSWSRWTERTTGQRVTAGSRCCLTG
ncbi:hypothetical protein LZ31DRAFT_552540 [Colletotrichum somersetense]|nr:hypothetical protein LZ31DRAFT_552540 [Colletotrichum somersetense]